MEKLIRRKLTITVLVLVLMIIIFFVIFRHAKTTMRQIEFGAWTQGLFDPISQSLNPNVLIKFEKTIHKKVSIAHFYIGWEKLSDKSIITDLNVLFSHGWEPMINVNPYYFQGCKVENKSIYQAITNGDCDKFLIDSAKNLSQIKKPFFFVFSWEMNNNDNSWSIQYTKSSPNDFIRAWQHMHNIFVKNRVKAIWVFCPNVPAKSDLPYKNFYPGDNYVDWVGLDGYNWGTTQSWSEFLSFSDIFKSSYNDITSISKNKPVMIAEFNTTDKGGDKGKWYLSTLSYEIPYEFPKIMAIVLFNEDRTKQENVDWKVDVNKNSLDGFIKGINSGFYY